MALATAACPAARRQAAAKLVWLYNPVTPFMARRKAGFLLPLCSFVAFVVELLSCPTQAPLN